MESMELLGLAKTIRLRTHNGKYLVADDDGKSVRQDRDGEAKRANWTIEFNCNEKNIVYLKSCHGKYLTASNKPFVPKINGFKVIQSEPERLNSSHQWEIERDGIRIRLRTRYGQFLRPRSNNLLLWRRNSIAHEVPYRMKSGNQLLWEFDIVETNNNNNNNNATHHRTQSDSVVSKSTSSPSPFSCTFTVCEAPDAV